MRSETTQIALIGYTGNALLAYECFFSFGMTVSAYTAKQEVAENRLMLTYLGAEMNALEALGKYRYFVCYDDPAERRRVTDMLREKMGEPENALHKSAIISRSLNCGTGNLFAPRCVVNSGVIMGNGILLGTGCILDNHCGIGDYVTLGAGVIVGEGAIIGNEAVLEPGVIVMKGAEIAKGAIIKAGTVVEKP